MWYWHAWVGFVVLAVILFIGSIIDARREADEELGIKGTKKPQP